MLDIATFQKGVRIIFGISQELYEFLMARRHEITAIAEERRPPHVYGRLSEVADGIWSKPTVGAARRLGAVGVQLNGVWAQLPPDWNCPCCNRPKTDIIFKSDDGVIIAQAVEHHDHFVGYVNYAFQRELGKSWRRFSNCCGSPA
jgi:hypothetical protein